MMTPARWEPPPGPDAAWRFDRNERPTEIDAGGAYRNLHGTHVFRQTMVHTICGSTPYPQIDQQRNRGRSHFASRSSQSRIWSRKAKKPMVWACDVAIHVWSYPPSGYDWTFYSVVVKALAANRLAGIGVFVWWDWWFARQLPLNRVLPVRKP